MHDEGLSPYTRGNHGYKCAWCEKTGSIPVHTGKPCRASAMPKKMRVYPRTHGKPASLSAMSLSSGVYPRTHGETRGIQKLKSYCQGLSPYTRGNHGRGFGTAHGNRSIPYTRGNRIQWERHIKEVRSIPVHTGKPTQPDFCKYPIRVYPRTHGETRASFTHRISFLGLSPYTRGNRQYVFISPPIYGSIPVHTGKPGKR